MAPKKQKAAVARAPASKEPVTRSDGKPTRAEKSAANKAKAKAAYEGAQKDVAKTIDVIKTEGRKAITTNASTVKLIERPTNIGRPWLLPYVEWTEVLAKDLFILISTGHSMESIAALEGMPPLSQMLGWLAEKSHPFVDLRARAKESLIPFFEEKAADFATKPNHFILKTRKQVVTKDGDVIWVTEKKEVDNVARSALALQGLQWTLSHLMPKKHGRNPDLIGDKPNEQLEGLFAALKAGPKE